MKTELQIQQQSLKHCKQVDTDYQDQSYSDFYAGAEWANKSQMWKTVSDNVPDEGTLYDIVIYWPDNQKQEERKAYVYKSKHGVAEIGSYFQHKYFFDLGLYEEMFATAEGLVTHYRPHQPLPQPPKEKDNG